MMKFLKKSAVALAAVALVGGASVVPAVNAAEHLDHYTLMALKPDPNVKGQVGIFVYDGVNAMDALGPFQVFSTAGLSPRLISKNGGRITTNSGIVIDDTLKFSDITSLGILVVPGGALETAMQTMDPEVLQWIQSIDKTTRYTTSVCTGAWILGAAGLLRGLPATTNWYSADEVLKKYRAIPRSSQRYVFAGRNAEKDHIVTSAGVTAGIDMALAIVKRLYRNDNFNGKDFTQAVMLDLQYDPMPPVIGGTPRKTDPHVLGAMTEMYDMFFKSPMYPGMSDFLLNLKPLP